MFHVASRRRLGLGVAAATLLSLALAAPTFAVNTVTQTVTGGAYTSSIANLTLGAVTVSHVSQTSTGTLALTADDLTGTATGWNVTVQSSALVYSGANGATPANDIAATNVSLGTPATPVMTAGQAVDVTNGPKAVGTGGAINAAVKVINANALFGQGTYTQNLPLTVTIPANPRAGTYTATLTVTIISGP